MRLRDHAPPSPVRALPCVPARMAGRMPAFASGALALAAMFATGCAGTTTTDAAHAPATVVLVRHAEKATQAADPRDPPLSPAGEARAQALATALADAPLVAIYATPYRRTQSTAAPTAAAHGIAVTVEDPADDAAAVARALRARHPAGTVLVVGHSNTVPPLVAALCGCAPPAIGDDDFGDLFVVAPGDDGRPRLTQARFGP